MSKYIELSREELLKLVESQQKELKRKKYGLVWDSEKVPEKVVMDCEKQLPILQRIDEKEIKTDETNDNILIEGDNYHALTVLNYTHQEKIDVIYIDPPYNTGNKDFIYNDSYVDKEDGYRHSKWLNFMEKRLNLAKQLLKDDGVIFLSIDDNEQANLKLLCDKIFGVDNYIGCLPTIMNLKGNNDQFGFAGTHEYTLVYSKNISNTIIKHFDIDEEEMLKAWEEDEIGYYKKGATLKATGEDALREKRPQMYYPILFDEKNNTISSISANEYNLIYDKSNKKFNDKYVDELREKYQNQGYHFIVPKDDKGNKTRWRWGWNNNTISKLQTDVIVSNNKNGISFYKKQRPGLGDLPTKKPKSTLYRPEYSSGNGTGQLKDIFHDKVFNNPKPIDLIKDFLTISTEKNSTVLDFMAGSGTTGHAVLSLNKEDGGNRKFILCTNNENNICEGVTYPRIKKVIEGYKNFKGDQIEGLNGNLKYFKTDLIDSTQNIDQVRYNLTQRCTEMLCIKENIFNLVKGEQDYKIYVSNDKQRYLCVYYNLQEESFDSFLEEIKSIDREKAIYQFSPDNYVDESVYKGISDVSIEPIPHKILEVYKQLISLNIKQK